MGVEDTPDHIFVDVDSECFVDLLCAPRTSEPWVMLLQFDDSLDELLPRALGHRLSLAVGGIQQTVLSLLEQVVKCQER